MTACAECECVAGALAEDTRLGLKSRSVLLVLDVELVRTGGSSRGRWAESAGRKEEREDGATLSERIAGRILVKVSSGSKHIVRFLVRPGEPPLPLEDTDVNGDDTGVLLGRILDMFGVTKRGVGIKKMVGTSGKGDPFTVGCKGRKVLTESAPGILDADGHAGLPLIKCLPGGLEGTNNTLFEVSRVLLHDDDRLLESVLLVNLVMKRLVS